MPTHQLPSARCAQPRGLARRTQVRRLCTSLVEVTRVARVSSRCVSAKAVSTSLPSTTYDYIIVGGGLSGCVLANRLSSDPSKQVLLLEAGENNEDPIVKAPAGLTRLFKHPNLDWNLSTVEQQTMGGRSSYLARGKLLGGSSATNATLYHRGAASDYDAWGCSGWDSKDVLPWFKRAEDNPAFGDSSFHGTGGAMHVERPIYQSPLFEQFFNSAKACGIQENPDFNDWGRSQEGYGDFQVSITDRGRRADAYRQLLAPVLDRENLTVVTRAQTRKILFRSSGSSSEPTAVGVEVQSVKRGAAAAPTGEERAIMLRDGGEVLLAAGTVHTPQILMLSGVGPSSKLAEHNIKCISDLPAVGQNLQDHPAVLSAFQFKEEVGPVSITDHVYDSNANIKPLQLLNWLVLGRGPLTSTACDRGAFVRTDSSLPQPDLQLRFAPGLALNPDGVGSFVDFGRLKADGKISKWPSGATFQIIAIRPKSRGSIGLKSASITDKPAIDLAYCTDKAGVDLATLKAGLKLSRKLAATDAWSSMIDFELHPGTGKQSDEDIEQYISQTLHSANALVGTCAMGDSSSGAVSPQDLSVHGVQGLRVVDASIMPKIPGGQTGAPTVMIAERAATMIAQGHSTVSTLEPALAAT